MIRSLTLAAENGATANLSLTDPWGQGVAVLKVDGLGPVKSDIFVTNYGARSGGYYNGSRAATRDITLTLKPLGIDIERVRRWLYNVLPVQGRVTFTVKTDYAELETVGYVESFEPDIFSKFSTYTVGLRCPDPFFTETGSLINTTVELTNSGPLFEFPFSNPMYGQEIEFSRTLPKGQFYLVYDGQVSVGMTVTISFKTDPGTYVLVRSGRGEYVKVLNANNRMKAGGRLVLISEIGRRSARYTDSAGQTTDLAWTTWEQGDWPMLYPGENALSVDTQNGSEFKAIVQYTKKFLGV